MTEKSPFSKFDHIGVIVRDLDKAIEYYQSLGIGPFELFDEQVMDTLTDKTMCGRPVDFKMRVAAAQLGSVKFELTQPVEDCPVPEEFLKSKGEGINHICFLVDDIEEEKAKLIDKGLEIIQGANFAHGGGGAHFDAREVGGINIELVQW